LNDPFPPTSIIKDPLQPPNLFYRGSSMKGTFKPGDKLVTEKVFYDQIKKGDLIIFGREADENSDFIVHRVADIAPDGLITRGDNCRDRDIGLVSEEKIIGRVIRFDRRGEIHQARNGWLGVIRAKVLHGRIHIARGVKFFFRTPYLLIRNFGILKKFWHPEIEIIHLNTPDGSLDKYVHRGLSVAIHWIGNNRWYLKRPYDFIIGPQLPNQVKESQQI